MRKLLVALLLCGSASVFGQVKITQGVDRIDVDVNGKPFTTLFYGGQWGKPYLHPLRAASGTAVTRMFPMDTKVGETTDHPHHNGVWFTHGDVNGVDFWMNDPSSKSPKKGKVLVDRVVSATGGEKDGSIVAVFNWIDHEGKKLITENRTMKFYADALYRIVDFDVTFTANEKVKFGDTKEGTFAVRLTTEMDGEHTGKMTNAEGKEGEKLVWGKPSHWVDYSGKIAGESVGVTIMDHHDNPKHPTYWHSRNYGLFAANIFGERDFFADRTRDGGVSLEVGKSMRFRYRVLIHAGDTASVPVANLYKSYMAGK